MEIIHENEYVYKMNDEIEPYLATHRQEGYIPGAEDHLHRKDMGIVRSLRRKQPMYCQHSEPLDLQLRSILPLTTQVISMHVTRRSL